jgi:hypothetical protein
MIVIGGGGGNGGDIGLCIRYRPTFVGNTKSWRASEEHRVNAFPECRVRPRFPSDSSLEELERLNVNRPNTCAEASQIS